MATIWMAKEGSDPARGAPWRTMTIPDCVKKLGLRQSNFLCELTHPPKFGDAQKPPTIFREPVAVVIKIDTKEAAEQGWKAGFFLLDLTPSEAERQIAP